MQPEACSIYPFSPITEIKIVVWKLTAEIPYVCS